MALALGLFFFFCLTIFSTKAFEQPYIKLPSDCSSSSSSEKPTHVHFYFHEIRNDKNPSIAQIAYSPENFPNSFGSTFVMDDAMTEGPELSSKHIGRAQGVFGVESLEELWMFMLTNFVFTDGDYAGSTLSMVGRNHVLEQGREMPIVGGTGVFRFVTGYAIVNSLYSISTPEHLVLEYNVTLRYPST